MTRRTATVIAAVMICVMLAALAVVDRRSAAVFREELRANSLDAVAKLHERLTARLLQDVATARSLANSTVVTARAQARFDAYTEYQLREMDHFIGIAVAPDFAVHTLYPKKWIADVPRDDVRAMVQRHLSGFARANPVATVWEPVVETAGNGTMMVIAPLTNPESEEPSRRGAVALLLDRDQFLRKAGAHPDTALGDNQKGINIAIREANAATPFVGSQKVVAAAPVTKTLDLAGTEWEIMAVPEAGWDAINPVHRALRTTLGIVALSMLLPILVAGVLLAERNRHIDMLRARETKLLELSKRFKLAMDSANIGMWEIGEGGADFYLDERSAALHGFANGEKTLSVAEWLAAIAPGDRLQAEAFLFNCTDGAQTCSEVYRVPMADGSTRYLRSAAANYRKPDGSRQTAGIIWDVTSDMTVADTLRESKRMSDAKNAQLELALQELSSREQQLEELSGRLEMALKSYHCGIWEADPGDFSALWDERMYELYDFPQESDRVTLERLRDRLHPEDRDMAFGIEAQSGEIVMQRILLADGAVRYIRSVGQLHTGSDGKKKIVGIAFDVTSDVLIADQLKAAKDEAEAKNAELEQAKTRIEHNALHDPLTGLANRRKLDQALDALSNVPPGEAKRFAILHLDLDRFKQINDTLGHAAGDAMLIHTSEILTRYVHARDIVARIGGDEFVILVREPGELDRVKTMAAKIIAAFRQSFEFDGFACRCGVSIGIAFGEGANADARKTLIDADLALYHAKAMGRNRYEFFTQNLQSDILRNKRTADDILAGLENGEFEAWYQPQFCAHSMQLAGMEALVRWRHPSRGLLTPDKFLKIAEELNVVAVIDHLVLQSALRDKRLWALQGIEVPRVSVNVSAKRLGDEHLIDGLKELAIKPGEVAFELVESIFLDESEDKTLANLSGIKALGIDIEVDDFGTGHTSIISLLRLKPKRLKIDRQLVMPIISSSQERALVRSIIDLARSLGIETVAEGVETAEHAALLSGLGCDLLQGYAFAKPLPSREFSAFIATERRMVS